MSSTSFSMRGLLRSLTASTSTTTTTTMCRCLAPTSSPTTLPLLPRRPAPAAAPAAAAQPPRARPFTTTPFLAARQANKKPKAGSAPLKKKLDPKEARALAARRRLQAQTALDPKVAGMMKFLYAPSQTPPPLRMARQRYLRHWTIHRAWQLVRRRAADAREREMMRMSQSMAAACEALRNLEGPGTRPRGWLFRKSMEKVGVWGPNAVPIEYARPLVETPGERPWNHEWKRA